jgi:RimJ/RimL family protein N-acetyltransferase
MTAALAAPSPLRDGEVTLLPLDPDVPALLVAASYDDEITRWTQVPHGMTLVDAGLVVAGWASNSRVVRLQICLPDQGPAGLVTVWINQRDRAEVGYWLLAPARGRGVARRAVRLLCDWAFATCGVDELELTTLLGNTASEKVATACGFSAAGTIDRDVAGDTRTVRLWVRRSADTPKRDQRASIGR